MKMSARILLYKNSSIKRAADVQMSLS